MADTKPQIREAQQIPVRKRKRNILLGISYSVHVTLSIFVKRQRKKCKNVKKSDLTGKVVFFLRTKNKNNSKLSSEPYKKEKGKLKH